MDDLISRQDAINAMWNALYEYEDKIEKIFQESDKLDIGDWILRDRMWVQNGHDVCHDAVLKVPPAEKEIKTGKCIEDGPYLVCSVCDASFDYEIIFMVKEGGLNFCPNCGTKWERRTE